MKKIACLTVVLALLWSAGAAAQEGVSAGWTEKTETGAAASYVRYPVADGENADVINALLAENGRLADYVQLLSTVQDNGGTGLQVDYAMTPADGENDIVSVVLSAQGKMLSGPPGQAYYPLVLDRTTGQQVTAAQVFADVDEARGVIEGYLMETVESTLSTYMENNALVPVPMERFSLDEGGVTFYYESSQLSFLSGFCGAVTVPYDVLYDVLDVSDGSVVTRSGLAAEYMQVTDETAEKVRRDAEDGRLWGVPAVIGMPLADALAAYQDTVDSGFYPGGAYYETEEASLRGTCLITDENEETVTALLSTNVSLHGLRTGSTTREAWRAVLGEPDYTIEMTGVEAESHLLCDGEGDYYELDGVRLTLHADQQGVLYAVVLTE